MSGGAYEYVQDLMASVAYCVRRDAEGQTAGVSDAMMRAADLCEAAARAVSDVDWYISDDITADVLVREACQWPRLMRSPE